MADLTHTTLTPARFSLRTFFTRLFDGLIALAESGSTARALKAISELSDADIEARGTTREAMIRKVLGAHVYV